MTLMFAGREYLGTLVGQLAGSSGHTTGALKAGGGPGMSLDCALALQRGAVAPPVPALVRAAGAQPETGADGIWSGTLACAIAQPRAVRVHVINGRGTFNQSGLDMKLRIDGNAIAADLIVQGDSRELIGRFKGSVTEVSGRATGTLVAGGYAAAALPRKDCVLTLARGEIAPRADAPVAASQ